MVASEEITSRAIDSEALEPLNAEVKTMRVESLKVRRAREALADAEGKLLEAKRRLAEQIDELEIVGRPIEFESGKAYQVDYIGYLNSGSVRYLHEQGNYRNPRFECDLAGLKGKIVGCRPVFEDDESVDVMLIVALKEARTIAVPVSRENFMIGELPAPEEIPF